LALIQVFADEAGMHDVPFMLIGGIWAEHSSALRLRQILDETCASFEYFSEVKWERIRRFKLDCIYAWLEAFLHSDGTWFEAIVIEKRLVDWQREHGGDKDLGFYRYYSLLLSNRMEVGHEYEVTVDSRNSRSKTPLIDLLMYSNTLFERRHRQSVLPPIRRISAQDSKQERLVQLADLLLGVVSSSYQPRHINQGKTLVIEHLCRGLGRRMLGQHCVEENGKFNVWEWKPDQKDGRPDS
jgi:hypothetical protein